MSSNITKKMKKDLAHNVGVNSVFTCVYFEVLNHQILPFFSLLIFIVMVTTLVNGFTTESVARTSLRGLLYFIFLGYWS